jgi:hypothetical protein
MSEPHPFAETFKTTLSGPEALLRVQVGIASPLWGLFAGAAMSGSAWWWMTRWTRTENLEAMFGAAMLSADAPASLVETAQAESVPDLAQLAAEEEAVVEAIIEPPVLDAPVGGESAPIGPAVVAALPAEAAEARPRTRKAEPKAD